MSTALDKIRNADFFFGVWHHEKDKPGTLSPWLPFEFGAARTIGKPFKLIAHNSIPKQLTRRIDKNFSLIEYDDENFGAVISRIIKACRKDWERE